VGGAPDASARQRGRGGRHAASPGSGADDLPLAFDLSDRAAELALAHFGAGVAATLKADGTSVTEADRAVERLLRDALAAARPGDALLGEELGRLGASERVWFLDPIDGTLYPNAARHGKLCAALGSPSRA
jgi:histidinol-phosphatase